MDIFVIIYLLLTEYLFENLHVFHSFKVIYVSNLNIIGKKMTLLYKNIVLLCKNVVLLDAKINFY